MALYFPTEGQSSPAKQSAGGSGVVQASATAPQTSPTSSPVEKGGLKELPLTLDAAVGYALENNPALVAVRTQRGISAAGIVIAKQYPFNPLVQVFELAANGPPEAGVTNHAFNETTMRLDLEVRGQGRIRQAGAAATLSRTEWDIATQEVTVAVATIRAHSTALYRQKRLELQDETIRLTEQVYDQTKKLADLGRLRAADIIVARTNLSAARAQRAQSESAIAVARADLRRLLGTDADTFVLTGELVVPPPTTDREQLTHAALQVRPDVNARRLMVSEAEALYKLEVANRFGNPSIGPGFEYNETRATFVGMWLVTPIPALNTRKGEILQRQAAVTRSIADVRQFETQAGLEVQAALTRLEAARKWADAYAKEVLPSLRQARDEMEKLFAANEPGLDVLKLIGVQQNYLQALGLHLDAEFEVSQANADLALAVGDPVLAVGGYCQPKQPVVQPQPQLHPTPGDNPTAQQPPPPAAQPAGSPDGVDRR
ncbi:Heavy metal RND efflux outer membrane protein, CzcC family [Fimbriiglobus ruber]|uniref:Heavy metal RND efflux outer membrane protein, CzcC family n=1 Tax=Fimbriiglobus ruber TaxID=1908690 RepID=A0A225DDK2_9BACT|nr:Heavy metal RND efflux outer membrane protein, CzcC family [Fimbriiglobus ruber]